MSKSFHYKYSLLFLFVNIFFITCKDNKDSLLKSDYEKGLLSQEEKWFTSIFKASWTPQKVYRLHLYGQNLKELPKSIYRFPNLTHLNLASNQLNNIPDDIDTLKHLEVLYLSDNQIVKFPKNVCKLANLKELKIDKNRFKELPTDLTALQNLEILDLSNNHLKSIPDTLGYLFQLKQLDLSYNQLTKFPINIIHSNKFQYEGSEVVAMAEMAQNKSKIEAFPQLETLELHHNHFTTIPKNVGKLPKLNSISLSHNLFASIPQNTSQLQTIAEVSLLPQSKIPDNQALIYAKYNSTGRFLKLKQGDYLSFDFINPSEDTITLFWYGEVKGDTSTFLKALEEGKLDSLYNKEIKVGWDLGEKERKKAKGNYAKILELKELYLLEKKEKQSN